MVPEELGGLAEKNGEAYGFALYLARNPVEQGKALRPGDCRAPAPGVLDPNLVQVLTLAEGLSPRGTAGVLCVRGLIVPPSPVGEALMSG